MLLPILASAFVGGIIGYVTNWLAIKMLFRPLTEKYLGSWRLPFTPGLIPKKRAALAQSLGSTVTDYLVTTDTLSVAVGHPQFTENLASLLDRVWSGIAKEQRTLVSLLQASGLDTYLEPLCAHLAASILAAARNHHWSANSNHDKLTDAIKEFPWPEISNIVADALYLLVTSDSVQTNFGQELASLLVNLQTEERLLADVIPLSLQEQIHNRLLNDVPSWLDQLQLTLQQPDNKALLQTLIGEFLGGNTLLRLLGAFTDNTKLAEALINALTKEEIRSQIATWLLNAWERLLTQSLATLTAKLDLDELLPVLHHTLAELLQSGLPVSLHSALYQSLKLQDGQIAGDFELTQQLKGLGRQAWEQVIESPAMAAQLKAVLHILLLKLLQFSPAAIIARLQLTPPTALAPQLQAWLLQMVNNYGPELLQALRLTQVVEAQVNDLNILQVEDILLQIIREQLTAITNLGFLLGALIGTIMPFINNLLGRW